MAYADDFNRADSASSMGANWTNTLGTMGISSNKAYNAVSSSNASATYVSPLLADDFSVQGTVTVASGSFAYLKGAVGPNAETYLGVDPTGMDLASIASGSFVSRGGFSGTFSTGDVIMLQRRGIYYTSWQNGIQRGSWVDSGNILPINSTNRSAAIGVDQSTGPNTARWDDWFATELTAKPKLVAANSAAVSASRSPAITFNTGWTPAVNDVVVFWVSSTAAAVTITIPSGWINPLGGTTDVESDSHEMCCVYHLVTAAEASGVTRTYTATNLYDATQTGQVAGCVIRGVDPNSVIDSANSTSDLANSATPHILASLTGTNLLNDSLVMSAVAKDTTGTYTTPSGWTVATSANTNQALSLLIRVDYTTAGSNVAATNITPSVGDEYCSITAAFTEASTSKGQSINRAPLIRSSLY